MIIGFSNVDLNDFSRELACVEHRYRNFDLLSVRRDRAAKLVAIQLISVSETQPVDVLVLMKFNTWPGVTAKYSGTFAGTTAEALFAVTTAVKSRVTQRASVEASRTCLV
jgi:hypothetical protein